MKTYEAKLFSETRYLLGESPAYDPRTGKLSFVDIIKGEFYTMTDDGTMERADFGQHIGAAVPTQNPDEYIVAATDGLYLCKSKDISLHKELKTTFESYQRSNDAKADPMGRLWFGSSNDDGDHEPSGNLYCYNNGELVVKQPNTKIANGMAWNAARDKFFFSDSLFYAVFSYDYNKETGEISDRKVLFEIQDGVPDGMCIDSEDNLWVAIWGGRRIEKRSSVTGELLARIDVPAEHVTSCCFCGPELDRLFITSSGDGLDGDYDGCLFTCMVDSKGCAVDYAKV